MSLDALNDCFGELIRKTTWKIFKMINDAETVKYVASLYVIPLFSCFAHLIVMLNLNCYSKGLPKYDLLRSSLLHFKVLLFPLILLQVET